MKSYVLLLVFTLIFVTGCETSNTKSTIGQETPTTYEEYQRIYSLEHRLIPRFLFSDDGEFFNEIATNGDALMEKFWSDVVGPSRASENITEYEVCTTELAVAFLTFPSPPMPVACYHAAIIKSDNGFRYITLEMTHDLSGDGYISAYCEWTGDGTHLNYGPRKYKDLASFKSEVISKLDLMKVSESSEIQAFTKMH